MKKKATGAVWSTLAVAVTLVTTPAFAHHSFAGYDLNVTKTISGTLKDFVLSAPHSGLTVAGRDESGKMQTVSVTTGTPGTVSRQGFKPKDFRLGSLVKLTWHPNRNGMPGGELIEVTLEDGRVLRGGFGSQPGAAKGSPPSTGGPENSVHEQRKLRTGT